ncbi:MAG: hypothetical protein A2849_02805 [Candidatus Taylorbacteria bacterium RIFCSPHIGHO2_01_FULL_51_15]|uniref:Endonuclease/exonuclease/phosphatase domain-containing protein n=1 Tax=Candidatus Taylorbacteria bacterium RIFCSPHIGHO2_01_FULL_51_15 TaxID=1802304 RepID=A0A1G2MDM7_9BACT|nr:MAG: hypothetical protein A2849_02805 [Candidatus Taylorbacteria bacterium RIFCSPHIGHO2_01_FULL_51_15]
MRAEVAIKLISLNIEMNKHLPEIAVFLRKEKPDVLCLQEVSEYDFPRFQERLAMQGRFEPMLRIRGLRPQRTLKDGTIGLALFSRFPGVFEANYYSGNPSHIPDEREDNQGANHLLLSIRFSVAGAEYAIGTTHFAWTPDGEASNAQREDLKRLLVALERFPHLVFCGDFNAPRGGEIWAAIAKRYKDNIPASYLSSLDPRLHRAGHLTLMVEGLFSSPDYLVSNVRLVEGVSDHKAIVGVLERT